MSSISRFGRAFVVQGWSSIIPHFSVVDFVSFYVEIPVMVLFYITWLGYHRFYFPHTPQQYTSTPNTIRQASPSSTGPSPTTPLLVKKSSHNIFHDFVDIRAVDLYIDEYTEEDSDVAEDSQRKQRLDGRAGWLWRLFYVAV